LRVHTRESEDAELMMPMRAPSELKATVNTANVMEKINHYARWTSHDSAAGAAAAAAAAAVVGVVQNGGDSKSSKSSNMSCGEVGGTNGTPPKGSSGGVGKGLQQGLDKAAGPTAPIEVTAGDHDDEVVEGAEWDTVSQ
jgi:hypothetical protein